MADEKTVVRFEGKTYSVEEWNRLRLHRQLPAVKLSLNARVSTAVRRFLRWLNPSDALSSEVLLPVDNIRLRMRHGAFFAPAPNRRKSN